MPSFDADQLFRDLGRRFAEIRVERGLTQQDMAEHLDMSLKYLQRIEQGRRMTLATLARLAAQLDVPIASLFSPPQSREVRVGRPPSKRRSSGRARRRA